MFAMAAHGSSRACVLAGVTVQARMPNGTHSARGDAGRISSATKNPPTVRSVGLDEAPGSDLLSHGLSHTTIGAGAFHFRVRDGIGWDHAAISARELGESRDVRGLSKRLGRNKEWTLARAMRVEEGPF